MKLPFCCRVYEDNMPVGVEWCASLPAMTPRQAKPSSPCNSPEFYGSIWCFQNPQEHIKAIVAFIQIAT